MNKRMFINLAGQIVSFICGLSITFFLTPYIVANLGEELYGFVGLANNFTSYISLVIVTITGMLSRYITIEYAKKNYKKASGYFSTATFSQSVLAVISAAILSFVIINLEKVVNISPDYVGDVRILWALIFAAFIINLPFGGFSVSTFVKNRLEISAAINICGNVIRAGILVVAFVFFRPHIWYVGLATILSNIFTIIVNYIQYKKLMPEVKLSRSYFNKRYIYELVVVGVWNSLNKLQQILITGLDLLLTNLFISASEMGFLSIAKSLPTHISSLIGTVSGSFDPSMTLSYAKEDKTDFFKNTTIAMKMCGFLCSIPIIGVVIFGLDFYTLWMPSLTYNELMKVQVLAVLTLLPQVMSVYIYPLYTVNTITCKLKVPVLVSLGIGLANLGIVFLLLKLTEIGVYAVAGVSSVLWIIRILTFVPLYAAHVLNVKWSTFYPPIIRGGINVVTVGILFYIIRQFTTINSWMSLIIICGISAVLGYVVCFFIMFARDERKTAVDILKRKLIRRKQV